MTTIVVMAKEPVPGKVKTRLCPPCTPEQAAALAGAALHDTLVAVERASCDRRVLAFDGVSDRWARPGWDVVRQVEGGLDRRLDAAIASVIGPALVLGMDTPQVTPACLDRAWTTLFARGVDAVLGPSDDGGYWAIGVREPRAGLVTGVEMSTRRTGGRQRSRLQTLGLTVADLEPLRDVDTVADAITVAQQIPRSRFAAQLARTRLAA